MTLPNVDQGTDRLPPSTDQLPPPDPALTPPVVPVEPTPVIPPTSKPPDGNWEARFKGSVLKVEELTIATRDLTGQLQAKSSEIEQLKAELAKKDVEKTVAVSERDKNLQVSLTESAAKDTELASLRAYKLKVETAREMGHPELVTILGSIPDMTDPEVLKAVMGDFVQFRESGIQDREKALLSGLTPSVTPIINAPVTPTTKEGWEQYINTFPLGSKERSAASDSWYDWLQLQGK